jgi:hypothetical protein
MYRIPWWWCTDHSRAMASGQMFTFSCFRCFLTIYNDKMAYVCRLAATWRLEYLIDQKAYTFWCSTSVCSIDSVACWQCSILMICLASSVTLDHLLAGCMNKPYQGAWLWALSNATYLWHVYAWCNLAVRRASCQIASYSSNRSVILSFNRSKNDDSFIFSVSCCFLGWWWIFDCISLIQVLNYNARWYTWS